MRAHHQDDYSYHEPLRCVDLPIDQQKIAAHYDDAKVRLTQILQHEFGRAQVRLAIADGFEYALGSALLEFAQNVAHEISGAYVTEVLANARRSTANMFEALAGGALVTHRAASTDESRGIAHGFALVAAIEGRPEILRTHFQGEDEAAVDRSDATETP
jgi:predicted metallo-beta-lactamase superfamily hydrolase